MHAISGAEQLGRVGAVTFIGLVGGILVTGPLADRWGGRIFAVGGNGLIAMGLTTLHWTIDYPMLLGAAFIGGVGGGILDMILSPIVSSLTRGQSQNPALNVLHSFYCVGAIVTILAGSLALRFGLSWRILALGLLPMPVIVGLAFSFLPMPSLIEAGRARIRTGELMRQRFFLLTMVTIFLGGATEVGMAYCLVGDQLAPSGRIDPDVYQLVGEVYREVALKEPWCAGAQPVTEIGVLTPEEFAGGSERALPEALKGATRILEQGAHQFDVLDSASDFSKYRLLVLPDLVPVFGELTQKLEQYVASGGSIIASFASGMDEAQTRFNTDLFGVTVVNPGPRDLNGNLVRGLAFERHDYCEYLLPKGAIGHGLPQTEHAMYRRGMAIRAGADVEILAPMIGSFFDRTYRHFCSHRQTPSSGLEVQRASSARDVASIFRAPSSASTTTMPRAGASGWF